MLNYLPLILVLGFGFIYGLGICTVNFFIFIFTKKQQLQKFSLPNGQVPYTLTGELFPQQTRAWGCGLSLAARFLAQFVQLKVWWTRGWLQWWWWWGGEIHDDKADDNDDDYWQVFLHLVAAIGVPGFYWSCAVIYHHRHHRHWHHLHLMLYKIIFTTLTANQTTRWPPCWGEQLQCYFCRRPEGKHLLSSRSCLFSRYLIILRSACQSISFFLEVLLLSQYLNILRSACQSISLFLEVLLLSQYLIILRSACQSIYLFLEVLLLSQYLDILRSACQSISLFLEVLFLSQYLDILRSAFHLKSQTSSCLMSCLSIFSWYLRSSLLEGWRWQNPSSCNQNHRRRSRCDSFSYSVYIGILLKNTFYFCIGQFHKR